MRSAAAASRLAAVVLLFTAGCAPRGPGDSSGDAAGAGIAVSGAWARPSPAMASAGAAYLTLESPVADRLIEVRVPASVAARVELHEVVTGADGQMSMHPVAAIELPAGVAVELRPGSRHLMLMDLARPLAEGDTLDVTLRFERAPERRLRVPVREPSDP